MRHGIIWLNCFGGTERYPWVARITGTDSKYGLGREFLPPIDKKRSQRAYLLEPGHLYQIQPLMTLQEENKLGRRVPGDRKFVVIREEGLVEISTDEAMEMVAQMEEDKRAANREIDERIARVNFNSEGGFRVESN